MRVTKFNNIILDEKDILEGLYTGKIKDLSNVNTDDRALIDKFNQASKENFDNFTILKQFIESDKSISEFDIENQNNWFMPDEYKNLDIESYIFSLCKTEDDVHRIDEELKLFNQYQMINVLKYLKYLVETMRKNNVVWGVGRGSSVASYALYLLGVHKINSLKYQLDIREFLK